MTTHLPLSCTADELGTTPSDTAPATVTAGPAPDLTDYDVILVNSSAGKDSQASLDVVVEQARAAGVMGLRGEESTARARRAAYAANPSASNGRRRVDDWYPIHRYTVADVWDRIAVAGTRPHPAYAAGMSRLSCRFCVLASRADLVCSARLNPALADRYAAVEAAAGHTFRADLSMADIIAEARGQQPQLSLLDLADIA
ncbi:hypothetical protein ACJH6J_23915 [Mycobacterium sp. SMC-18]|uniref:hypothetical protein n=1 Tax=unclassified Mycobacterium TaxID=2642494 RepID=UPI003876AF2C